MSPEEKKLQLLARARLRLAQQGGQAPAPVSGLGSALADGWDQAGLAIGKGVEGLGQLTGSQTLMDYGAAKAAANQAEIAARNYQRPEDADGILKNLQEGDLLGAGKSLIYGAAENAAPVGAGIAATVGAGVATAATGGTALAGLGLAAGGTALGTVEALGEARLEKEQKGLNDEATLTDLGTAVASGLVELTPLGKGAGYALKFTKEGLQEATQEGLIIGGTSLQGGEYVPEEVAQRMFDAGVIGGTLSKGADMAMGAAGSAAQVASGIRYDSREFSDDEKRAAEALLRAADGRMDYLGNVDDDVGKGTAKGTANAALRRIRAEVADMASSLRTLAKEADAKGANVAINTLTRIGQHQGSALPDTYIEDLRFAFQKLRDELGDIREVNQLGSLVSQIDTIAHFTTRGDRDMGGISRVTKNFDITDTRNTAFSRGALGAVALGAGLTTTGILPAAGAVAAGIAKNRLARVFDRATNRRSMVKRFVESAARDGKAPSPIGGKTADQALKELRQRKMVQQAALNLQIAAAQKGSSASTAQALLNPSNAPAVQTAQTKTLANEATQTQQAEANAQNYSLNEAATQSIFDEDTVPEGVPFYEPYAMWQKATGAGPDTTLGVIEQLEREGIAPQGTAARFRQNIRSFPTSGKGADDTYALQNLVRERIDKNYKPNFNKPKAEKPRVFDAEKIAAQVATRAANARDQYEFKRLRGQGARTVLDQQIMEAADGLSADQYQALMNLTAAIDSAGVTRADRFKLVNEMLPTIFPEAGVAELWRKRFTPLAAAGNDVAYTKEDTEDIEAEKADEKLEEAQKKAIKRKKEKDRKSAAQEQPDQGPVSPQTTEDRALEKLKRSEAPALDQSKEDPATVPTVEEQSRQAEEPDLTVVEATKPKKGKEADPDKALAKLLKDGEKGKKLPIKQRLDDRVEQIVQMEELAELGVDFLNERLELLSRNKGLDSRVEQLFYEMAGQAQRTKKGEVFGPTVNMLVDAFAARNPDIPVMEAARLVNEQLESMEKKGLLKRFVRRGNTKLKYDGKYVRDADGKNLQVLSIEFIDPDLKNLVSIARAVKKVNGMVNQDQADVEFSPTQLREGEFRAIKDVDPARVDESFWPLLGFLNDLRNMKMAVNDDILTQIEDAVAKATDRKVGTIGDVLLPEGDDNRRDEGPLRTIAQLIYQLGPKGQRQSTLFRMEWMAGANGRVYSKNGLAHTQAGDIMKGLMRMPTRKKVGGEEGLKFIFHSIGNLLGKDKEAPFDRRATPFMLSGRRGAMVADELYRFAQNPFGPTILKNSSGETTALGKIVKDGEGFVQVLNAAHEVKRMADFAKARFPNKAKLKVGQLLQDPEVQADLSANFETDFIVQLDASNNAYQIAGLVMGDQDVMRATGMLPNESVEDPDKTKGADIYMGPATNIAERVPELKALVDSGTISPQKLRKLFKKPISTYLYAAAFNSRQNAFADVLDDIAGDAEIIGIDGDGLIEIPADVVSALRSDQGATFVGDKYDITGEVKEQKTVRKRVRGDDQNGYRVETASGGKGGFNQGGKRFKTEADAMRYAYHMDLMVRMNDELIRDMNVRFPNVRNYLRFADAVAAVVKDRRDAATEQSKADFEKVKVPSPDGIMWEYHFRQDPIYASYETKLPDGKVVQLGVRTNEFKIAGRGLAAFMTHQLDAWALRETYRRMKQNGGIDGFNPIHDSYGFHAADAERGRETWTQVMFEIGSPNFNLMLQILEANGISQEELMAKLKPEEQGAIRALLNARKGVDPVPAKRIPTALS